MNAASRSANATRRKSIPNNFPCTSPYIEECGEWNGVPSVTTRKRIVLIVLDGVGVGELPDAEQYGDAGSNTLGNLARAQGGLSLPNLQAMGLGNILPIEGVHPAASPRASFGKLGCRSNGKDSTTGHWELGGLIVEKKFPTFPRGFPKAIMDRFLRVTGESGFLGNKPASGTTIIQELGDEHVRTGYPIVYTSADSVFQIAAHERVIPVARLYELCQLTRDAVCVGEAAVGRVIARPFLGASGGYSRTTRRKDFSLAPFGLTMLDVLQAAGIETVGIGKIEDLYAARGLTHAVHTAGNSEGIEETLRAMAQVESGLIMVNLVDFDMLYGHRNDTKGFAGALRAFDDALPAIVAGLGEEDVLVLTADHGNDPVTPSTDHSREYVPVLWYAPSMPAVGVGTRSTFADVGKSVVDYFGVPNSLAGTSMLAEIVQAKR